MKYPIQISYEEILNRVMDEEAAKLEMLPADLVSLKAVTIENASQKFIEPLVQVASALDVPESLYKSALHMNEQEERFLREIVQKIIKEWKAQRQNQNN